MGAPVAQQSPALMTGPQLMAMTPSDRSAYLSTLQNPNDAAAAAAVLADTKRRMNALYLDQAVTKKAVCPVAGGGTSATYAAGATLNFALPTASGAFAKWLEIYVDIKFTPATGTSATYGWTPAGAFAWFSDMYLNYNGTQIHLRPYMLKIYDTIRRAQRLAYSQVLSGLNSDSTINGNLAAAQPTLTGGSAATSKFRIRIPLNAIHQLNPAGLLPMQGNGVQGQIQLVCASTLGAANPDPMQTPINFTGGTGNAITLDASEKTIQVFVGYVDGTNYNSPTPLTLDLVGEPTVQWIVDTPLNNLTSGSVLRQRITPLLQHYVVASVIIDGVQSTNFATPGNISALELDQDSVGQNKFWQYNSAANLTVYDYYQEIRQLLGQDLDDGVILWNFAQAMGQQNIDNQMGSRVLNATTGGWTDLTYGVQVASVSSTNFSPRVETYLISLNPVGLVQQ